MMSKQYRRIRCLIVDENQQWRHQTHAYLRQRGIEAVEADNEDLALRRFVLEKPGVVLIGTPRASRFIRRLRRCGEGKDAIVILCPESGDVAEVGEAIWHGATDYIAKPFNSQVFDNKLRQTGILHLAANSGSAYRQDTHCH